MDWLSQQILTGGGGGVFVGGTYFNLSVQGVLLNDLSMLQRQAVTDL